MQLPERAKTTADPPLLQGCWRSSTSWVSPTLWCGTQMANTSSSHARWGLHFGNAHGQGLHVLHISSLRLLTERQTQHSRASNTGNTEALDKSSCVHALKIHFGLGSDIAPNSVAACPNPKAVLQVTGQDDLPQRFAALKRRASTRRGEPRPTLDLAWVPLTDILDPATR